MKSTQKTAVLVPGTFKFKDLQGQPQEAHNERFKSSPNAFLTALFKMIEDPSCGNVICWGDDGVSFYIWRPLEFETLIPKYFGVKKTFATFRQRIDELGFQRLPVTERGPAKGCSTLVSNWWAFQNPTFSQQFILSKLVPGDERLNVWPIDAWVESIKDDYAWMATLNPGKPLEMNIQEKQVATGKHKPEFKETHFPVY